MTDTALEDPDTLLAREAELRARGGSLRMRDAAAALGVPEAALVEARRRTGAAVRLARPDAAEGFGRVLARLPEAGEVMALTRNETAVHEKVGRFAPPGIDGALGQVVGDIDLRLFLQHWRWGYALSEGGHRSLQFFDAAGAAIHKVYRREATDAAAFEAIVAAFADADAAPARFEAAAPAEARASGRRGRRRRPAGGLGRAEADQPVLRADAAVRGDARPGHAPRRPGVRARRSRLGRAVGARGRGRDAACR